MSRRLVICLLGFIFLLSSTELHQFWRLPALLIHFEQHQRQDDPMDFFEFIQLHYLAEHPDDKDDADDRELPFKSNETIVHLDHGLINNHKLPDLTAATFPVIYGVNVSEGHPCKPVQGIFHPPRRVG